MQPAKPTFWDLLIPIAQPVESSFAPKPYAVPTSPPKNAAAPAYTPNAAIVNALAPAKITERAGNRPNSILLDLKPVRGAK